jgi:hypothetical protein
MLANSLPGGGVTEILGTHPGQILADKMGMAWRRGHSAYVAVR